MSIVSSNNAKEVAQCVTGVKSLSNGELSQLSVGSDGKVKVSGSASGLPTLMDVLGPGSMYGGLQGQSVGVSCNFSLSTPICGKQEEDPLDDIIFLSNVDALKTQESRVVNVEKYKKISFSLQCKSLVHDLPNGQCVIYWSNKENIGGIENTDWTVLTSFGLTPSYSKTDSSSTICKLNFRCLKAVWTPQLKENRQYFTSHIILKASTFT